MFLDALPNFYGGGKEGELYPFYQKRVNQPTYLELSLGWLSLWNSHDIGLLPLPMRRHCFGLCMVTKISDMLAMNQGEPFLGPAHSIVRSNI